MIANVEVGSHFYLEWAGLKFHGQTIFMSWFVIFVLILFTLLGTHKLTMFPKRAQNFMEYVYEFFHSITKNQIGEKHYRFWISYIGTLFLFILLSNWSSLLLPLKIISLPNGELGAPTNDINTTVALALLTSILYFYAGLTRHRWHYFGKYLEPLPILLPIHLLEDFTKPLSLSFRLFGNVIADELVVSVFVLLFPIFIPLPIMALGLFSSFVQALIFSTLSALYIGEAIDEKS